MDNNLIKSVLGFDLNADIKDENGKIIPTGVRSTVHPEKSELHISYRIFNKSFFTSFDDGLLEKIREHRRLND
jgi:hypothetical protein